MSLSAVPAGDRIPDEINVIIEIPAHSDPVKYEVDKKTGAVFVDRFMSAAMFYPCNYGYIPNTLSEDGDPLDVLVIAPHRIISGTVIRCRPIGLLKMSDEAGIDFKLLALPTKKQTAIYDSVEEYTDLPPVYIRQIEHFFEHYKDLEPGKWVKVEGWEGAAEAKRQILAAVENFRRRQGGG
ncbi:MAG: inorganic pyrophosphatase [Porticoccaceae bacterium]|nr:MAG: inorganic pyrophosphatase [Porticoccaceae bacterium]